MSDTKSFPITSVFCRFNLEAIHRWADAPKQFIHLSYPHRHVFHFDVGVHVDHDNRHIEFIELRARLIEAVSAALIEKHVEWGVFAIPDWGSKSCEMIAAIVADILVSQGYEPAYVKVSEDGENGAFLAYGR